MLRSFLFWILLTLTVFPFFSLLTLEVTVLEFMGFEVFILELMNVPLSPIFWIYKLWRFRFGNL